MGLLWAGDRPAAETSTCTTQHLQETGIHDPGGIRTRNLSRRAAEDPRLKTARTSGSTVGNFLQRNDVTSHTDDDDSYS